MQEKPTTCQQLAFSQKERPLPDTFTGLPQKESRSFLTKVFQTTTVVVYPKHMNCIVELIVKDEVVPYDDSARSLTILRLCFTQKRMPGEQFHTPIDLEQMNR
ncbi:MAG: hypothetical protein ABGX16_13670 [Pirellulales bacterium]